MFELASRSGAMRQLATLFGNRLMLPVTRIAYDRFADVLLASLVIALAPYSFVVVGARALQGLGAAFAVAGTLAAVSEAAPDSRRAEAIGTWTGFLMLGFSIGPLIGGAVTHYAGWRFVFWL